MEVGVISALQFGMQVSMSSVLPSSVEADITIIALYGIVLVKVLQVVRLGISQLRRCFDEGVFGAAACVGALGDIDGTIEAMSVLVALAMVCLELQRNQTSSREIATQP